MESLKLRVALLMTFLILIVNGIIGSIAADMQGKSNSKAAPQTNFTSVYTDMRQDCKSLPEPPGTPEGVDPIVACKGYGDYRILISYSACTAGLEVESLKNPNDTISLGEDYGDGRGGGRKVEWRMANSKPFAVIIRFGKHKGDDFCAFERTDSKLVIKGLKDWEHIDFEIDGATPDANVKAREMADQNYSKK